MTVIEGRGLGAKYRNQLLHSAACNKANKSLAWCEQATDRAQANHSRACREGRLYYVRSTVRTLRMARAEEARVRAARDAICAVECVCASPA